MMSHVPNGDSLRMDVLLGTHNGCTLPGFRDIAGFQRRGTPPLFHRNFRDVPFGLDCDVVAPRREDPKLFV